MTRPVTSNRPGLPPPADSNDRDAVERAARGLADAIASGDADDVDFWQDRLQSVDRPS